MRRLLGTVRFSHLDMATGYRLNTQTGELTPRGQTPKAGKPTRLGSLGQKAKKLSRPSRTKSQDAEATVTASPPSAKAKVA